MAFLAKTDFKTYIDTDDLDIITQADDSIITEASDAAQVEVESYLRDRYDTTTMFAAAGAARDKLLIKLMIDIVLYEIFSKLNPRNIPEYRIQRRDDTIQYLKDVGNPRLNISPAFPLRVIDGDDRGFDISHGITTNPNTY
jgi:phage gp36-like protein